MQNIEKKNEMLNTFYPNQTIFQDNNKEKLNNLFYYSSPEPLNTSNDSSPVDFSSFYGYNYLMNNNDPYLNNLKDNKNDIKQISATFPIPTSSNISNPNQILTNPIRFSTEANFDQSYFDHLNQYFNNTSSNTFAEPESINTNDVDLGLMLNWDIMNNKETKKKRIYKKNLNEKSCNKKLDQFVCTEPNCGKIFTRPYNLKAHSKIHTHERPFVCSVCHISFSRLHDMKRHMNLHSGLKPYCCPHCDKSFARLDALNRHIKKDKNSCSTVVRTEKKKLNKLNQEIGKSKSENLGFMDFSNSMNSESIKLEFN